MDSSKVTFSLKKKKSKGSVGGNQVVSSSNHVGNPKAVQDEFGANDLEKQTHDYSNDINHESATAAAPLVIPLLQETTTSSTKSSSILLGRQQRFLQQDEDNAHPSELPSNNHATTRVDDTTSKEQFQKELQALPDQSDVSAYSKVPIADFGAAMLRGMGWKDERTTANKKEEGILPRPHRLGLGAIPKANMELFPQDKKKKLTPLQLQQQEEFEKQRQEQKKNDKQQTLQKGSIVSVYLQDQTTRRAQVIQLLGVPGLNMVKVYLENHSEASTAIKRGQLGPLIARQELLEHPFRTRVKETTTTPDNHSQTLSSKKRSSSRHSERDERDRDKGRRYEQDERRSSSTKRRREDHSADNRYYHDREDDHRKRERKERREEEYQRKKRKEDRSSSQNDKKRKEDHYSWMIPNIRVRIITEKLGKRFFRQKAVVMDVTRRGATINITDTGDVIDRVPEIYLETALPKSGGHAIVLTGQHKYAKGRLLERDSRSSTGVIQVFEDMNVLTLSLDDMAEWCGPLDDDLE